MRTADNLAVPTLAGSNNFRVHPVAPVVGVDVDGTLADYYEHFRWFAELYLQRPIPAPDWSFTSEFSEALNIGKEEYRQVKLAYRQGGMKRSLPRLDEYVTPVIEQIRLDGIQVWICTTRPWLRLDNIDPDTRFWIERNLGRVDGVIYGEEKYEDLIDLVGKERILGIIDDLPENIELAESLGLRSVIRAGGHNAYWRKEIDGKRAPEVRTPVARSTMDFYNQVKGWAS